MCSISQSRVCQPIAALCATHSEGSPMGISEPAMQSALNSPWKSGCRGVNLDAASYRPAHARPLATSGNQAQPLHGGCIADAGPKRSEPQWIAFAGLHPCPKPKIGPTEEMLLPTWVGRRSQEEEHKASIQVCSSAAAMCTSQERCSAGHLNTAIGSADCTK